MFKNVKAITSDEKYQLCIRWLRELADALENQEYEIDDRLIEDINDFKETMDKYINHISIDDFKANISIENLRNREFDEDEDEEPEYYDLVDISTGITYFIYLDEDDVSVSCRVCRNMDIPDWVKEAE